jgi:hypothetical protein
MGHGHHTYTGVDNVHSTFVRTNGANLTPHAHRQQRIEEKNLQEIPRRSVM